MKPILYYHPFSPPVRSVLLLIKALNLDIDLKLVDLIKRENRLPEYLKVTMLNKILNEIEINLGFYIIQINPMHTVPVLKSKDLTLMDSHSILMYLADAFGSETPLFGKNDIIKRANIVNKLMFNATFFFRRDSELFVKDFIGFKTSFIMYYIVGRCFYSSKERFQGPQCQNSRSISMFGDIFI